MANALIILLITLAVGIALTAVSATQQWHQVFIITGASIIGVSLIGLLIRRAYRKRAGKRARMTDPELVGLQPIQYGQKME
jgi:predicted permease